MQGYQTVKVKLLAIDTSGGQVETWHRLKVAQGGQTHCAGAESRTCSSSTGHAAAEAAALAAAFAASAAVGDASIIAAACRGADGKGCTGDHMWATGAEKRVQSKMKVSHTAQARRTIENAGRAVGLPARRQARLWARQTFSA